MKAQIKIVLILIVLAGIALYVLRELPPIAAELFVDSGADELLNRTAANLSNMK